MSTGHNTGAEPQEVRRRIAVQRVRFTDEQIRLRYESSETMCVHATRHVLILRQIVEAHMSAEALIVRQATGQRLEQRRLSVSRRREYECH